MTRHSVLAVLCVLLLGALHASAQVKVYILAGQSNMEGHAKVETFDYIGDDPATAPLLARMRASDGKPRVCDNVWISYLTGGRRGHGEGFGKLTAGYGARRNPKEDGGKIGPEFTFGLTMEEAHPKTPILIIKTAWGGKSLNTDFRPPSAGPYVLTEQHLAKLTKKNVEKAKADKLAATGVYYRKMIEHVKTVLGDIKRVYPGYDAKKGYELAGFAWFQGWNDMVDRRTYPQRDKPGGYDQYSRCLAAFIRDVRKDLKAPGLPFVIGVMGVGGPFETQKKVNKVHEQFRAAMAAPASLPEFKGNVVAVQTAPFWDTKLAELDGKLGKVRQMSRFLRNKHKKHANKDGKMSRKEQRAYIAKYRTELLGEEGEALLKRGASNAGYHYLGCAKTMAGIGKAFAEAMLAMEAEATR